MPLGFLIISVAIAKHLTEFAADNNVHLVFFRLCFLFSDAGTISAEEYPVYLKLRDHLYN